MTFIANQEQQELCTVIKRFFAEEVNQDYLRKRIAQNKYCDQELWNKFIALGMFEYFNSSQSSNGALNNGILNNGTLNNGTLHELGFLAVEAGKVICPENIVDALLVGPLLYSHLSESDRNLIKQRYKISEKQIFEGDLRGALAIQLKSPTVQDNTDSKVNLDYVPAIEASQFLVCITVSPQNNTTAPLQLALLSGQEKKIDRVNCEAFELTLHYSHLSMEKSLFLELSSVKSEWLCHAWLALKACELAGIAQHCVELTVTHTSQRKQFGVPVGAFQAVQHQLADAHLKAETCHALACFAAWACNVSPQQFLLAARSAIWYARQVVPEVVECAIQLHGGMGFTWEHELHLYLRRAKSIETMTAFVTEAEWCRSMLELTN